MSRQYYNPQVTDVNVVTTNETAAITTAPVSVTLDGDPIYISGSLNFTTGASTTSVTVRCRRGVGVAGALVQETEPYTIGAAANATIPFGFQDIPGAVAGQQYTITIQQTAATGNGTVNNAEATLFVGSP